MSPARPIVAAAGVVIDAADRVLVVRRARAPGAGGWTVPGGKVRFGERLIDAVVREVQEETGLTVRPGPCVWTAEIIDVEHDVHFVVFDYRCTPVAGTAQAASDATELRWLERDALSSVPLLGETAAAITAAYLEPAP